MGVLLHQRVRENVVEHIPKKRLQNVVFGTEMRVEGRTGDATVGQDVLHGYLRVVFLAEALAKAAVNSG